MSVAALVIASSGSAFASELTSQDIQAADQLSQGDVNAATAKRKAELVALIKESGLLAGQVSELKKSIEGKENVRNVTIIMSIGLATASTLLIRNAKQEPNISGMLKKIFGSLVTGGLAGVGVLTAAGTQVAITLDANRLNDLEKVMNLTNEKLRNELKGLN